MSHVWAAQRLLPEMLERGEGYLVSTASAAGLTTQVSAAPYSVTKHAAVAWPSGWRSPTASAGSPSRACARRACRRRCSRTRRPSRSALRCSRPGASWTPHDVAEVAVEAIREERFLILPHPEVAKHIAFKGADPERWLDGHAARDRRGPPRSAKLIARCGFSQPAARSRGRASPPSRASSASSASQRSPAARRPRDAPPAPAAGPPRGRPSGRPGPRAGRRAGTGARSSRSGASAPGRRSRA